MKTGLFFGSFNPIHIGHMALANYFIEYTDLEQLWFVISPHNPLKKKESLLNDEFRLDMVELAIADDDRFMVCDIEFRMPRPSYTIDTLTYLAEKYPDNEFVLIMGTDSLVTFHKWKNYGQIIANHKRYIYPRFTTAEVDYAQHENIKLVKQAPRLEISSSFIRKALQQEKDIRHFLPKTVYDYIVRYNFYGK